VTAREPGTTILTDIAAPGEVFTTSPCEQRVLAVAACRVLGQLASARLECRARPGHAGPVKIGAGFNLSGAAFYRGVYMLEALRRRGHKIVWPENGTGAPLFDRIATCDVFYLQRRYESAIRTHASKLAEQGIAIVWDNDDDLAALPRLSPNYKFEGGIRGHKLFGETVRMARIADVVTVSTPVLRDRYSAAGVPDVRVIDNQLERKPKRKPRKHDGVVVGWIAGDEHRLDARELRIGATLRALQEVHPDLHVECVGVDLGLNDRYTYRRSVDFPELPDIMAGWDIGLAAVIDSPFNRARSTIKVKEYAASQVPWLASSCLPYAGLGEREGGRLVDPDGWHDALDALIRDERARQQLARAGRSWAKGQTVSATAKHWEQVFEEARDRARERRQAPQKAPRALARRAS
jgi:glycosyltransferase involved in cell wall biosynthesis